MKLPARTLEEIARIADVSRATVSRVINRHPYVREEIRVRVLEVIEQHGYVPNAAARAMVTKRTNIVGLVVPRLPQAWFINPTTFYPLIIHSVVDACTAHQRYVLLSMIARDQKINFYQDVLRGGHADGLILSDSRFDDPMLPLLQRSQMPAVLIGRNPAYPELHWVDVDNVRAADDAVTYLIERGRRRIATLTLPMLSAAGMDRRTGYEQALARHGMPIDPQLIVGPTTPDSDGYVAMQQLLALPEPPDAVFAASDIQALEAIAAIQAHGLRVPEDIAVVGFDDQPNAQRATPPLTTVRQPITDLGRHAVELLVQVLDRTVTEPQHVVLPTALVVRASA